MLCPVCRESLIVIEHDEIEIDYCVRCKGIWLDSFELEFIIENDEVCREILTGERFADVGKEKKRVCPICDKKMRKVILGEEGGRITLDRCPRGDGIWLDRGEVDALLQIGAPPEEEGVVISFLEKVFRDPGEANSETTEEEV